MAKSFRVKKRDTPRLLTFKLEDEDNEFSFRPPKIGPILLAMASDKVTDQIGAQLRWFLSGLSEKTREHIQSRLDNDDDDLDIDTIQEVMGYLMGKAASNNDEDKPSSNDRPSSSQQDW